MKDKSRTKQGLLEEINVLKQRIKQLEQSELELKRAEEALRESEESYRRLFESSPAAIYQVDFRTGKFLKANDIFCDHFGCGQEEITSHSPFDLLTDESKQLLLERLNKISLGEKVTETPEYEVIDKNGRRLWFQLSSKNIYDSEGLMGADVVAHDITDRKLMEEELQRANDELELRVAERSEELMLINKELREETDERKRANEALLESEGKYRTLIENIQDGIYLLDSSGNFTFVNDVIAKRSGFPAEWFLGRSFLDVIIEEDRERMQRYFNEVMDGKTQLYDISYKSKFGDLLQVEVSAAPLFDGASVIALIGISRDITERRRAAEELEKYRKQLEDMVKERTAELENKNITLQELNTALRVLLKQREDDKKDMEDRFVLNVRNLVLPYVEMMKKGPLNVAQQPYLDIIETHLNEIATPLLKNLKQFNLTPREVRVAALVRQGKPTKEIAEILMISTGSIDIHRKNIRKKLDLSNRKANLQSHLENLEQ